jgi:hypothetical protein
MATSFFALVCLTLLGFGVCRQINRSRSWVLNPFIEIGAGFFVIAAITALFLSSALFSVSRASQISFIGSVLIVAALLFNSDYRQTLLNLFTVATPNMIGILLTLVITTYLLLILLNNSARDIFPWDAFTTWMYRAKVWVMSGSTLDFITVEEWIQSGADGYTLAAAHYPTSVSAIAAFSAALSGGWNEQAASLPWAFASLASLLIMIGLCRLQKPDQALMPLCGGTLLITAPLVHLHGILAGYADIWVMGTSGMGLAALCIWTRLRSREVLYLGFLLLALGCFWKTEGWLWLIIGTLMMATYILWQRLGKHIFVLGFLLILVGYLFQPFDLGGLGAWGIDAEGMKLGLLGTVDIRPYNPLGAYFKMTMLRSNFLLIAPFYIAAVLWIVFSRQRHLCGYLLVGLGVATSHGIIFGLSAYSEYAEIGTAINRLFLQTLPVLIITITAAISETAPRERVAAQMNDSHTAAEERYGLITKLPAILLLLPCTFFIFFLTNDDANSSSEFALYPASSMQAVVGALVEGPKGYQIMGTDLPIGVAKTPITSPGKIQPRYVVARTWMESPETIAFYWINENTPKVHSVPILVSGVSVVDMSDHPEFWQKPITEMGYLIPPQSFRTTALKSLALTNSLPATIPANLNHWITPEPVSQKLINMTTSHISSPITLQTWLTLMFLVVCIVGTVWAAFYDHKKDVTSMVLTAAGVFWLIGSTAHINQILTMTSSVLNGSNQLLRGESPDGSNLRELSEFISESRGQMDQPIFTVNLDEQGRFAAERLPFMLAPLRAASITEAQISRIGTNINGTLLLLGGDKEELREKAKQYAEANEHSLQHEGEGYAMLSMGD